MNKSYHTLALNSISDHVLAASLNRPDRANALNTQMAEDLLDLWTTLYRNPGEIRAIILTGQGDRAFCAGADLKERDGMSDDDWRSQHALFEQMIRAMMDCPVPIIGAVNGAAYAGGLEIALACDFLYASETARFAFTEVSIGIMPGAAGTQNLPRAVGVRRAKEIILTARPFGADDALAWGLVNRLHPAERLMEEAIGAADAIAANAPIATRQAKKAVGVATQTDLKTGYDFEIEAYNRLVGTADRIEGIASFNEKRKPVFKGG